MVHFWIYLSCYSYIFSDFEGQFTFFFQKRDFINDSVSGSGGNFERVQ